MPVHPFYFAVQVSSPGRSEALLEALASQVLRHAGCSPRELPQLDAALSQAVAAAPSVGDAGAPRCDVRFCLENGALEILVTANGGRVFETSHPIPDQS